MLKSNFLGFVSRMVMMGGEDDEPVAVKKFCKSRPLVGPALRCAHSKHAQKAGPFSVARPKMDLPFHNRLAYNRVHSRSASPMVE